MADSKFTGVSPDFVPSGPIRHAVQRGRLVHVLAGVVCSDLRRAMCERSATDAEVDRYARQAGGAS
jgi:hypothetical protein